MDWHCVEAMIHTINAPSNKRRELDSNTRLQTASQLCSSSILIFSAVPVSRCASVDAALHLSMPMLWSGSFLRLCLSYPTLSLNL